MEMSIFNNRHNVVPRRQVGTVPVQVGTVPVHSYWHLELQLGSWLDQSRATSFNASIFGINHSTGTPKGSASEAVQPRLGEEA